MTLQCAIKENRTYDQVFGDLKEGDGDPGLVFFDKTSTANHRALALRIGLFELLHDRRGHLVGAHLVDRRYVTDYSEKTYLRCIPIGAQPAGFASDVPR